LQAVIKKEAEKFHQVRGSTIDYMRDEERRIADLSTDLSRFINDRAKCLYSRWIHISHSDEYSPCRPLVLLCFQAFENSRYSVEELIKLRDSQAMSKLHIKMSETKRACLASSRTVEYLFNNLHDEIEKRLHELTSEKDESDEEGVFGLMLLAALLAFF